MNVRPAHPPPLVFTKGLWSAAPPPAREQVPLPPLPLAAARPPGIAVSKSPRKRVRKVSNVGILKGNLL